MDVSNATGTVVFQGGSLNAGALTKTNAGILELAVSNTFTSVSITTGEIGVGANGSLGANGVSLDAGRLTTTSSVTTVANAVNVASGGGTLSVAGTTAFTGVITTVPGAAANATYVLTKEGAGSVTIDKALGRQMTKNTTGGAFTLQVTNGAITLSGATQKNLGGAMTWDGNVSLTGGTVMLHAATVTGSGTVAIDGATTIQSRLDFGRSSIANRTIINSALTLTCSSGASLDLTGVVTGNGGITTTGAGTVRLKGTATDGVSTLSGTLAVTNTGTTEVFSASLGSLTPGINAGSILRFTNPVDGDFAGPISGAGGVLISTVNAKQTLSGSNNYAGTTTIETDCTLLINGTNSGGGATTVAVNAILGGTGSLAGVVTFAQGAKFQFNSLAPLAVTGNVAFTDPASFGIDDIVGLDATVQEGTYTLLAGTVNTTGLANLGSSDAYSLGSGKSAYFQSGSLQVVVVPEPATLSLIGMAGLAVVLCRRRCRR